MQPYFIKINSLEKVNNDVSKIVTDKPKAVNHISAHAPEISTNKTAWKNEKHSFTFPCFPTDNSLELTITIYQSPKGATNEPRQLKAGNRLILNDILRAIAHKAESALIGRRRGCNVLYFKDEVGRQTVINVGRGIKGFSKKKYVEINGDIQLKILHKSFLNLQYYSI